MTLKGGKHGQSSMCMEVARSASSALETHPSSWLLSLLLLGAVGCSHSHSGSATDSGIAHDGAIVADASIKDSGIDSGNPPDGSTPPGDGAVDIDGSNNNGDGSTANPDGSTTPANPDASTNRDGSTANPDGSTAHANPDGSTAPANPDGSTAPANPDGSVVGGGGGNPDGSVAGGDGGLGGLSDIIAAGAINFGLQPCGGNAPAPRTVSFTNPTGVTLTYTATLASSTVFSLTGQSSGSVTGSVAPGATASLTINAAGVDASATAGQAISTNLTITTNAPAPNDSVTVPVTVVPQGATLAVVPGTSPSASWAVVPYNQVATPVPIQLRNTGNADAVVAVTQPAVTQFTLRNGTNPATSLTVPAASGGTPGSVNLSASFAPTFVGPLASSAGLTVAAPVCNGGTPSATQVSFEGTGTGTGFVATTSSPLAPAVNCGATGAGLPTATISVGNYTPSTLTFTASLLAGVASPFALSVSSESVNSQATATLGVSLLAAAVPQTAVPGTVLSDTVVLTPPSGLGLSPIQLPISTTVQGAVLSFGSATAFNAATNAVPQDQLLTISNSGNLPASPTLSIVGGDASLFTLTNPLTPASVPGGSIASPGQSQFTASFRPPVGDAATKNTNVVLTPAPTDVICAAASPAPLALSGTASTPGFHLDTPSDGTIAFGNAGFVACPAGNAVGTPASLTPAPVQQVRFTNTGSQTLTWSATLPGTNFAADTLGGVLAPNQQGVITLTPAPIPYPANTTTNFYGATLTITTGIVNDQPHVVSLVQTAQGAILTASASGDFGTVHNGLTGTLLNALTVQNTGNAGTNLTLSPTVTTPVGSTPSPTYPQYTFNGVTNAPSVLALAANDSASINGLFAPGPALSDSITSTVSEALTTDASPLCAPLPAALSFSGTGTDANVTFSSSSVTYPTAPATVCGHTATPITIVVSNIGNEDFDITGLSLANGAGSAFTAYIGASTITTATVPKSNNGTPGTAAITIAPKRVPTGTVGSTTFTDNLSVPYSINGVPQTPELIMISEDSTCP